MTLAGERTPLLSGAIPTFEMFLTNWEQLQGNLRVGDFVSKGVATATKYYNRMDQTDAYIVSMCEFRSN